MNKKTKWGIIIVELELLERNLPQLLKKTTNRYDKVMGN